MDFVDTSFLIALQVPRDNHHGAARELWSSSTGRLVTTNHVVGETWTGLRRRAGHQAAAAFRRAIVNEPRLDVWHVTPEQEQAAWRWLLRRDEREYSFVDATSFVVMRALKVAEAFAFDGDFAAAGFIERRP